MRQLITRIDDTLHARLKARARAEGESVNSLVTRVLRDAVSQPGDTRQALRRRLASLAILADVPPPPSPPDRDAVIEALRGAGTITDLIEIERDQR